MAYTIQSQILETIYGGLYKGYDSKTGSVVAMKLSNASAIYRKGENPLGEIEILRKFKPGDHDGAAYVIQLYDTFLTEICGVSFYCSVMELAENGDLLDRITTLKSQGRQLSFSNCRRYLWMLAKGLNFVHQQGISHLDLSLENILITKKDELRICDFGQAERGRYIEPSDSDVRKGKAKYMAPEVYNSQHYDGFKADVWSLGVCIWGMVTGGLLYRVASIEDYRYKTLTKGRKGIARLLHSDGVFDVPPLLIHLLSKMLVVDVNKRYLIQDVLAHPWLRGHSHDHLAKPIEGSPSEKTRSTDDKTRSSDQNGSSDKNETLENSLERHGTLENSLERHGTSENSLENNETLENNQGTPTSTSSLGSSESDKSASENGELKFFSSPSSTTKTLSPHRYISRSLPDLLDSPPTPTKGSLKSSLSHLLLKKTKRSPSDKKQPKPLMNFDKE